MYERFSDRARRAVALANATAQRFNHEYIGTEHMILGLLAEDCNAREILHRLSVDVEQVKRDVAALIQCGPDMVTMGKLPHTPRTKQAIEHAMDEARSMSANYVGTEHLLLGLMHDLEGVAGHVLSTNHRVTLDQARSVVKALGVHSNETPPPVTDRQQHSFTFRKAGQSLHDAAVEWSRQFQGKPLDLITLVDAFLAGAKHVTDGVLCGHPEFAFQMLLEKRLADRTPSSVSCSSSSPQGNQA